MLRANWLASILALILSVFAGLPDGGKDTTGNASMTYSASGSVVHGDLNKTVIGKITQQDYRTLAQIISAESQGESYEGQVAVGATILNRVKSPRFPKTITGVVYQIESGRYQYSPVYDGQIHKPPTQQAEKAAWAALAGADPTNGAIIFYNPDKTNDKWVRQQQVVATIGRHVFAV